MNSINGDIKFMARGISVGISDEGMQAMTAIKTMLLKRTRC